MVESVKHPPPPQLELLIIYINITSVWCVSTGKASVEWKRGPQPAAAGDVASPEALRGVIEELMNEVSTSLCPYPRGY